MWPQWWTILIYMSVICQFSVLILAMLMASDVCTNYHLSSLVGTVFGVIACAEVLCSIIGAAIFNPIYASTQDYMTGFVYITMAIFYLVGCGILLYVVIVYIYLLFILTVHILKNYESKEI